LLALRAVGPAVPLDMIRYLRRRSAGGDGLAEAFAMFLLPQLEGLDRDSARRVFGTLSRTISGWANKDALTEFRARYAELFPGLELPGE
jgi:hypothetical protein